MNVEILVFHPQDSEALLDSYRRVISDRFGLRMAKQGAALKCLA
jgi:hypothetical protein